MGKENMVSVRLFYTLGYFFMLIGTLIGTCYYVNRCNETELIQKYLENTGISLANNANYISITICSLKKHLLLYILLTLGACFRFGIALIFFMIVREGFVYGFTLSAFATVYGIKGGVVALSFLPQIMIFIPVMLIFSAVNAFISIHKLKKEKKIYCYYILFVFCVFTIFCVASLVEGFFTTIFMKLTISTVT